MAARTTVLLKEAAIFIRLLQCRFHQVSRHCMKKIQRADAETLLVWGERLLDAQILDDIFK